jgi:hypothetical protein
MQEVARLLRREEPGGFSASLCQDSEDLCAEPTVGKKSVPKTGLEVHAVARLEDDALVFQKDLCFPFEDKEKFFSLVTVEAFLSGHLRVHGE